jgi:class 3 adenylate cyclase/tetratricopeptide (TPR) repeat protein
MARDIGAWLEDLGLGKYAQAFADNEIDFEALPHLSDEDLQQIGLPLGPRRKLQRAIATLPTESQASPNLTEATSGLQGERRQVTVLFADLSGFTTLSSSLDAEEVHEILNRYFVTVDGIIARYGGAVDKHIGDSVMAVFGAPTAHTDDPERAARAACDVHDAMKTLSLDIGRDLKSHIGIASGQVVAGGTGSEAHREYTVTGETVNLASRLDDLAGPGETLVSKAVYDAICRIAACSERGTVPVKGIAEPLPVWSLDRIDTNLRTHRLSKFVGRKIELRQFETLLQGCIDHQQGHCVLVRGDPGIGKTRLVEEFVDIANEHGFAVHKSLVLDFGTTKGQDTIGALARSLLDIPHGSEKEARQEAAEKAIAADVMLASKRVFLNHLLDLPQRGEFRSLYEEMENRARDEGSSNALSALVSYRAKESPVLVTIEDIHWADQLTLEHLANLSEAISARAAVLVMTTRIEGPSVEEGWLATMSGSPLTVMELKPLRQDEALELAMNIRQGKPELLETYVARSGGNPLFLEQLMRNPGETTSDGLPETLQRLVLARIDRLPRTDKQALQAASVLGQRLSLDALRHVVGNSGYDCRTLIEDRLLRPEGQDYLFEHALIRDGAYDSLLRGRKKELHARAAEWFASTDPILQAEHLDLAEDPLAPQAYLAAAQQERDHHRTTRAVALVRRGLELRAEPEIRFALHSTEGELLEILNQFEDSVTAHGTAYELAPSNAGLCKSLLGRALGLLRLDRHSEAEELLNEAETLARETELTQVLAQIHRRRATIEFSRGNTQRSFDESQIAWTMATQCGLPFLEAEALSCMADAKAASGKFLSARNYYEQCIELCRQHNFRRFAIINLKMLADNAFYRGQTVASRSNFEAVVTEADALGDLRAEALARHMLAYLDCMAGKPEAAIEQLTLVREQILRIDIRRFLMNNHCLFAMAHRIKGDRSGAMAHLREAEAVGRQLGVIWAMPWVLGEKALTTLDGSERNRFIDEGEALLAEGAGAYFSFEFYRPALEASLEIRDWAHLERLAGNFTKTMGSEPVGLAEYVIRRARAIADAARGKKDNAALCALHDQAQAMKLFVDLPAIDSAIGQ